MNKTKMDLNSEENREEIIITENNPVDPVQEENQELELNKESIVEKEMVINDEEIVDKGSSSADGKQILIIALIVLGVFAFSLGGFKAYGHLTGGSSLTLSVDQLHDLNAQGKLDESRGYMYNKYSFVKVDGLWWTELMNQETLIKIPLHFGPKEVEMVLVEGEIGSEFNNGEKVFIAIDPNIANKYYTLALSELSFNVVKGIGRIPEGACTEENAVCENRTIINCENTQGQPVIELFLGGVPKIELIGSCIKISGEEYGIVRAVDRLLYRWYGIMK